MNTQTYPNKRRRRYLLIPVIIAAILFDPTATLNKVLSIATILIFIFDAALFVGPSYTHKIRKMAILEILSGLLFGLWIIFR